MYDMKSYTSYTHDDIMKFYYTHLENIGFKFSLERVPACNI